MRCPRTAARRHHNGDRYLRVGRVLRRLADRQHPTGSARGADRSRQSWKPIRRVLRWWRPRATGNITTTNAAKRATTPDKLHHLLRGDLDTILAKALKKDPCERYASVTALADDLRRYLRNEPISARPDTIAYRAAKFVRRNRTAVSLATLAIVATTGGLVGTLIQSRTARLERDFALRQVGRGAAPNDFHEFLLSDAAPSGKPFTVNELLGRAERVVEQQHAANDPNRVTLMIAIGRQYMEQDEAGRARRILEQAYESSRGLSDPSLRAGASCTLGATLARDEELTQSEALYQQGLRELPKGPQFTLERVDCLHNGSEALQRTREAVQSTSSSTRLHSRRLTPGRWSCIAGRTLPWPTIRRVRIRKPCPRLNGPRRYCPPLGGMTRKLLSRYSIIGH